MEGVQGLSVVLPGFNFLLSLFIVDLVPGVVEANETWHCLHFPFQTGVSEDISINFTVLLTEFYNIKPLGKGVYSASDNLAPEVESFKVQLTNEDHFRNNSFLGALGLLVFAEAVAVGLFNGTKVKLGNNSLCSNGNVIIGHKEINQTQFVTWFRDAAEQQKLWHIEFIKPLLSCWLVLGVSFALRRR